MKPVSGLVARKLSLSTRVSSPFTLPTAYCFRLPNQRGLAVGSGRNIPMNTWLAFCERLVALTGKLAEAKVEFTD